MRKLAAASTGRIWGDKECTQRPTGSRQDSAPNNSPTVNSEMSRTLSDLLPGMLGEDSKRSVLYHPYVPTSVASTTPLAGPR